MLVVEDGAPPDGSCVLGEELACHCDELLGAGVDDAVGDNAAVTLGLHEPAPGEAAEVLGHTWLRCAHGLDEFAVGRFPALEQDLQQPQPGCVPEGATPTIASTQRPCAAMTF